MGDTSKKGLTIRDVARTAGVSITTISRYLNGRYESMSEETKQKIGEVIEQLHYRPNPLAQGLKGNHTRMIAVIVVNISYPFCVSLIRALSNAISSSGYNLVVCETGANPVREQQIIDSLYAQRVDAMILQTNGDNNHLLAQIATDIPVVLVDRQFDIPGVTCVITDNEEASFLLTHTLFQTGYQNVLYVTEQVANISTRIQRLTGYLKACEQHDRTPWLGWITRDDPESVKHVARTVGDSLRQGPIAIYTGNALLLEKLYPSLRASGLQIPNELGLATFDEPDWIELINPRITCIKQPIEEIGTWTAKRILSSLKRGRSKPPSRHIIRSTVVIGESTRLNQTQDLNP